MFDVTPVMEELAGKVVRPDFIEELVPADVFAVTMHRGVPFLYGVRPTGTHLVHLHRPDGSQWFSWPAQSSPLRRQDLADFLANSVRSIAYQGTHRWLYFDGRKITEVSQRDAEKIANDWLGYVTFAWKRAA